MLSKLRRFGQRMMGLFKTGSRDSQLDEELRFHVEELTRDNVRAGMTPEEARQQARLALGGIERVKEEYRDGVGLRLLRDLGQDVRYGLRQLRRSPGFTVVAVLTLALGIGANTAIFTVVNAVLIRPLPFYDPSRLVRIWETEVSPHISELQPGRENLYSVSAPGFIDWQARTDMFEQTAAYHYFPSRFVLTGKGQPRELKAVRVTSNLFSTLGVQPWLGRSFLPEEEQQGRDNVAILSYETWNSQFNADESIVGTTATLSGRSYLIAGIMPRGFGFPRGEDFWVPLDLSRPGSGGHPGRQGGPRNTRNLETVARLKPGVSLERAYAVLKGMAEVNAHEYAESNKGWSVAVKPLREELVGKRRVPLLLLFAATGFVTLIACANLANMLLTRASRRRREMAVRAALGASRARLLRQSLVESILLALIAGAVGLLAGWSVLRGIASLGSTNIPRLEQLQLDWRVLCAALACSIATGLVAGAASALNACRADPNRGVRDAAPGDGARVTPRFSSALTVAELALALVLLAGAGLMLNTLVRLYNVDLGFEPSHLVTARVTLPGYKYSQLGSFNVSRARSFLTEVLARTEAIPGVESAAFVYPLPFAGQEGTSFEVEGRAHDDSAPPLMSHVRVATPQYFRTMRIGLLRGRYFTDADGPDAPKVAIINETIANRVFPNEDPIGRRVDIKNAVREIVGVVRPVRTLGLDQPPGAETYMPYAQLSNYSSLFLVARGSGSAGALAAALRDQVHGVDRDQPVEDVFTIEERIARNAADRRFYTLLLGVFALIAISLAAVGVYGVASYAVAQRTHEIGIRMAIGARQADVYSLFLGRQVRSALAGVAIGLSAALALTRALESMLFGIRAADPATFAGAALLLVTVALAAACFPARRAARVDPAITLRFE